MNKLGLRLLICSFPVVIVGCGGSSKVTENPIDAITPKQAPIKNVSGFNDAIQCVDELLGIMNPRRTVFMADDFKNQSGVTDGVVSNIRQMLLHTISEMGTKSKKVAILGIDNSNSNAFLNKRSVMSYKSAISEGRKVDAQNPDILITGGITQVEKDAEKGGEEYGLYVEKFAKIGYTDTKAISAISVSLSLVDLTNETVIPGLSSDNIMAVIKTDDGVSLKAGLIGYGGANYSVSFKKAEGMSAAVRALVQLNMIELVGKYFSIDYQGCLNPESAKDTIENARQSKARASQESIAAHHPVTDKLTIDISSRPEKLVAGKNIEFAVETSKKAYLYCFFSDYEGKVSRVYPNRFYPEGLVTPSEPLIIPGNKNVNFSVDNKGRQEMLTCMASENNMDSVVNSQFGRDFAPIVGDLSGVKAAFASRESNQVAVKDFIIVPTR